VSRSIVSRRRGLDNGDASGDDGEVRTRRRRQEVGNEAPMVITPRMVADLVRRTADLVREKTRRRKR
jgi:hypothetical protein